MASLPFWVTCRAAVTVPHSGLNQQWLYALLRDTRCSPIPAGRARPFSVRFITANCSWLLVTEGCPQHCPCQHPESPADFNAPTRYCQDDIRSSPHLGNLLSVPNWQHRPVSHSIRAIPRNHKKATNHLFSTPCTTTNKSGVLQLANTNAVQSLLIRGSGEVADSVSTGHLKRRGSGSPQENSDASLSLA